MEDIKSFISSKISSSILLFYSFKLGEAIRECLHLIEHLTTYWYISFFSHVKWEEVEIQKSIFMNANFLFST